MGSITPKLLARLIDEHAGALELFAGQWSASPADVVQEAFIELARQAASPDNLVAWLYAVVRNRALSDARSTSRRRRREMAVTLESSWQPATAESALDADEAAEALRSLTDDLREVVIARIWGELTFEQIASMIGASPSTAARRYAVAIDCLRTRMGFPCPTISTSTNR